MIIVFGWSNADRYKSYAARLALFSHLIKLRRFTFFITGVVEAGTVKIQVKMLAVYLLKTAF